MGGDGKSDIEGQCIKELNTLKYVGLVITNVQMCDRGIQNRISMAKIAVEILHGIV
jgi:hypothetical protein